MTRTVAGMVAITVLVTLGVVWHATSGVDEIPSSQRAAQSVLGEIYASGVVEGATPTVELRTELSGRVVEVLVVEGEMAQQGQALLRLDDREQHAQVALAESDLALAQAQLLRLENGADDAERREARGIYEAKRAEFERAQLAWKRTQGLIHQNAVSQQEADDNRTRVAALQAEVAAAAARLQHVESPARTDEVAMAKARIAAADARLQASSSHVGPYGPAGSLARASSFHRRRTRRTNRSGDARTSDSFGRHAKSSRSSIRRGIGRHAHTCGCRSTGPRRWAARSRISRDGPCCQPTDESEGGHDTLTHREI